METIYFYAMTQSFPLFKSYYVVWKLEEGQGTGFDYIRLNRTM